MIKCRKYIHAHSDNHLVNKVVHRQQGKWCEKNKKHDIFCVYVMKEGYPVTQEFHIERSKLNNDSFIFRVDVEEFSTQTKLAVREMCNCSRCKLFDEKESCSKCYVAMKMVKNTALIVD